MVAIAVFAVFTAIGVFVYKTRLQRQRNGRMKLTEHHADTLPQPYHEQKTFENPIYQVSGLLTKHGQHCHSSLSPTYAGPLSRPSLVTKFGPRLTQLDDFQQIKIQHDSEA